MEDNMAIIGCKQCRSFRTVLLTVIVEDDHMTEIGLLYHLQIHCGAHRYLLAFFFSFV